MRPKERTDARLTLQIFSLCCFKMEESLRIKIIFYVAGQKIRYKNVLPRH